MGTEEECGNVRFASKFCIQKYHICSILNFLWSIYENQMKLCFYFSIYRKPAMFEGLEIDQYIWSVLQNKQTVEFDEVTVDQNAKVKPCLQTIIKVRNL